MTSVRRVLSCTDKLRTDMSIGSLGGLFAAVQLLRSRADAVDALCRGYEHFLVALETIADDEAQKHETRHEADSLAKVMGTLEMGILCEVWNDILGRFNQCSKLLQSQSIELATAISLLKSLSTFVQDCRSEFEQYENKGIQRSGCNDYRAVTRRIRRRKRQHDEGQAADALENMSPREKFMVETFYVIIDKLLVALDHRIHAYSSTWNKFGFLAEYDKMTSEEVTTAASQLAAIYSNDLNPDFSTEFLQFTEFYRDQIENTQAKEKHVTVAQSMYNILKSTGAQCAFPNTEVALRMYLCLMVTNCSGERSFSKMKRIKSDIRSTMGQERLAALSLLYSESDILRKMDFAYVIGEFAKAKARKVDIFPSVNIVHAE